MTPTLTERLRMRSNAVFIAMDESPARDVSNHLIEAADSIDRITAERDAMKVALELLRGEAVLAIAFLGRDNGTTRLPETVKSLISRLAHADEEARAVLTSTETVTSDDGKSA